MSYTNSEMVEMRDKAYKQGQKDVYIDLASFILTGAILSIVVFLVL